MELPPNISKNGIAPTNGGGRSPVHTSTSQSKKFMINAIKTWIRPGNKRQFINEMKDGAAVLDVGCGNSTVLRIKALKPGIIYYGIDVDDYNQTPEAKAACAAYIITPGEAFAETIKKWDRTFDYIICTHNLEHCNDPYATLRALLGKVSGGGRVFIAFPSSATPDFPSRRGTLNFRDDSTHRTLIDLKMVKAIIGEAGLELETVVPRYQPTIMRLIGMLFEPASALLRRNLWGTWEFYGFETIVVARRP
jgi:2-polyprenyl-3-methyl-5-hydroxy-6-metoxy-1,4-benzoquinol methylase